MDEMHETYRWQNPSGRNCFGNGWILLSFEVYVTLILKICVFWDVKPYSLVEMYQCFGGTGCLSHPVSLWSSLF